MTGRATAAESAIRPALLALAVGAALWWFAASIAGQREAWDSAAYWGFAYPASLVAVAALAYFHRTRAWRWALLLFVGQFLGMCVRNGELGNLWPLGLMLFGVLALPGIAIARLVVARRRGTETD